MARSTPIIALKENNQKVDENEYFVLVHKRRGCRYHSRGQVNGKTLLFSCHLIHLCMLGVQGEGIWR